ncbi:hypothetical protein Ais01nite_41900 [Asanoa ishikariensis]|uniref:Uncharacterized protein n=1 Tax=Asanoa ishikariensis TaxID=137265 RepID=A0A1H3MJH8_9ACTN|nr:hypothetical protein [Asanoa ishikariensis]GIF66155.1 hypothetical protein Ais01nite_41900 [Asanoa ishikariensis]SDY76464.1 hypothetical protein SAMN05421684_1430 [Asanoa ishikariensis]
MALSACASTGGVGDGGGPAVSDRHEAIEQWAGEVADAWSPTSTAWKQGYVPLQEPVFVEGSLTGAEKQALAAGWWTTKVALPTDRPSPGTVVFRDGSLKAPLLSAASSYQKMDMGDPPPCGVTPSPVVVPSGPDGSVSEPGGGDCVGLTVSGVSLSTMELRTSRGVATVPAWRFEIDGGRAVLHAAVADPAPLPSPAATPTNREVPAGMVAAQSVTGADNLDLHYSLGVGACDHDITPIVVERPHVVVVTGGVTRDDGTCTDQLVISPVTASLTEPLGDRPVLDGLNGTLLPMGS